MMLQVKNSNESNRLFIAGLTVLCTVLLAGCKSQDPTEDPGDVENPNWVISVENDMTASMTAIVKVSFTDQAGTLAAFIGDECCGIAEYKAEYGLYWLYISPASEAGGNVQLRFYSPDLKRIFNATSTFPFRNDTQLGSVSEPYTPSWTVTK